PDAPRRTSFHMAVIDPRIADQGRAAWEREPDIDIEVQAIESVPRAPAYTYAVPSIDPPRDQPRRFARGSAPGIAQPGRAPTLPARPAGWEQHAPSVTARM